MIPFIVSKPDPINLFEQAFQYGVMNRIDIRELSELVDEFAASTLPVNSVRDQDLIELVFHRTLLEASHNTMLIRMHQVLSEFFSRAGKEFPEWETRQQTCRGLWEHRSITEALKLKNAERARMILSGHLEELIAE